MRARMLKTQQCLTAPPELLEIKGDNRFRTKAYRGARRQRADVARLRRRWVREQGMLNPARLVFIDETAVAG